MAVKSGFDTISGNGTVLANYFGGNHAFGDTSKIDCLTIHFRREKLKN